MRTLIPLLLLAASLPAFGTDDFKVIKLEQDVRNLERQVQELQRQLADVQQRENRIPAPRGESPAPASVAPSTKWLDASAWKQVRPGMKELDVISLLGPPTSMRGAEGSGSRTLMYAMEIGSSGFLGGSVVLRDRAVVEVSAPVLR